MDFMKAHDVPNWACFLLWTLAYMHTVLGEKRVVLSDELRRREP